MVGLHINPTKMNSMGKSQTISIHQLTIQLCKAHCPPPDTTKNGGEELIFFYSYDVKVWKFLVERGIKGETLDFP